jgi:hypothetical protein
MLKITELEYYLLGKAKNGVITFDQARGNGIFQSMHRMVKKGALEYVPPSGSAKHGHWKLTALGLEHRKPGAGQGGKEP